MEADTFQVKIIKNCRRYTKKCYYLTRAVDMTLVQELESYGILQLHEFSKYSPLAKDSYHIRLLDEIEISGALADHLVYIVIAKKANYQLFDELEQLLRNWCLPSS